MLQAVIRKDSLMHRHPAVNCMVAIVFVVCCLSRIAILCLSHLHSTDPLGGSPSEYCHDVRYEKTRMVWLPDGEKIVNTITHFDEMYERDRQTDTA